MNDASPIRTQPGQYFEDYPVGAVFVGGSIEVSEQDILDFARRYDPQLMHIDKPAAEVGQFGGLIASGWHTGSLTMRLIAETMPVKGGAMGAGIEASWPRPVVPGDVLRVEIEVLEARVSKSRPDKGVVRFRTTTLNQRDEAVQQCTHTALFPRRG
jgi:acyl dehydratase